MKNFLLGIILTLIIGGWITLAVVRVISVKVADLEKDLNWERNTKSELAEHLGKANDKITELKKRNAELKGMYAHSAREAGTYKQFFEKEKKENAELKEHIKDIKNCLEEWFKYENERDYELNVDELLIETQQLLDKEIENV